MYEHRYFVEIAFLDPVGPGSTRKRLVATAAAPEFRENFRAQPARGRSRRSPNRARDRRRETSLITRIRS
jgi:hypothetical protein